MWIATKQLRRPRAIASAVVPLAAFALPQPALANAPPCAEYPLQIDLPWDYEPTWAIDLDLDLACVASGTRGVRVIDMDAAGGPALGGIVDTPGDARDVAVRGSVAFVADLSGGLRILDVSDPANPVAAGALPSLTGARCVAAAGTHAYVRDTLQGLVVVDVSNPSAPFVAGALPISGSPSGMAATGSHVLVADDAAGLLVFDVSDPADPILVGFTPTPGTARRVAVAGSHAYVADDSSGVQVVDISNPAAPAIVGAVDTPGVARDVFVDGARAFVADGDGVRVLDVTDPTDPVLALSAPAAYPARAIVFGAGRAVVGTSRAILVLDPVAAPPSPVGSVVASGVVRDIAARGEYAYVVSDAGGLEVIRATDGGVSIVGRTDPPGVASSVSVSGHFAYLAAGDVIQVVDISNPTSPFLAGTSPPYVFPFGDVAASGSYAFAVAGAAGPAASGRLAVYDVSVPSAPTYVTDESLPGIGTISLVGDVAYTLTSAPGLGGSALRAIDVSNPFDPESTWGIGGYYWAAMAAGADRLCLSERYRLRVFDLLDPRHPTEMRWWTFDGCVSAAVIGGYTYLSTGSDAVGLRLLDLAGPATPEFAGAFDTPAPTGPVAVSGRFVFLADGPTRVLVLPLQCDAAATDAPVRLPPPASLALRPGAPNPFRDRTRIAYDLPAAGPVRIDVVDVTGRRVRSLLRHPAATAGRHAVEWDGFADAHGPVAPGVYFLRLEAGGEVRTRKLTRVR